MLGFLAAAAAGAAAAYFFDPQLGRGRRIRMKDQAMAKVRHGADDVQGMSQDLSNRTQGMAHEANDAVQSATQPISGR